jgi:cellulose synthase/poly-beta-1,6-N-acetylglucosamine synthase-like glycosyltransferase
VNIFSNSHLSLWQQHVARPDWNEAVIVSAAFGLAAMTIMLLLMQNGRWKSSVASIIGWVASVTVVAFATKEFCGDISSLAIPFLISALLSVAFRIYINRLTTFGFGLTFSLMYVGCCVTIYLGELARHYLMPENSPFMNGAIYFLQALSIGLAACKLTTGLIEVPLGICLRAPKRDAAEEMMRDLRGQYTPLVSIHVPCYSEPPELVIQTLNALAALRYQNFEVLVIDNNTKDEKLWRPVEAHCNRLGAHFRFFHVDPLAGAKAGAVNFALKYSNPAAEVICIVDADYIAEADFLDRYLPLFSNPKTGYVQLSHDYHSWEKSRFLTAAYQMYVNFHKICLPNFCEYDAGFTVGTMCLLRRTALEEAGGWAEWCLTEDSEVAVRIQALGYGGHSLADTGGRGLIPETFEGMKKQWFRWAAGPVQQFQRHWRLYVGLHPTKLSLAQRANEIMHSFSHFPHVYSLIVSLVLAPLAVLLALRWGDGPLPPVSPGVLVYLIVSSITVWVSRWISFNYLNLYVERDVPFFRGWKGLRTFAMSRLILSGLHWTYIVASIAPFFGKGLSWLRTDKFEKSFSLLRALHGSRWETAIAALYFAVGFLLLPFARFEPIDYTALIALWQFMNGIGLLSPLLISLYSEFSLSPSEMSESVEAG